MAKYKYIELVPKKHSKVFEIKAELWRYWQKRYEACSQSPEYFSSPKSFFDYRVITLNKDGSQRKLPPPMTEEHKEKIILANKIAMQKIKKETEARNKLKLSVEIHLNDYLKEMGYTGSVGIKFFGMKK